MSACILIESYPLKKIADYFDINDLSKKTIFKSNVFNYFIIHKNNKIYKKSNSFLFDKNLVKINNIVKIEGIEILKCDDFIVLFNNNLFIKKFEMYDEFLKYLKESYLLHFLIYRQDYKLPTFHNFYIKNKGWNFLVRNMKRLKRIYRFNSQRNIYYIIPQRSEEVYAYQKILLLRYGYYDEIKKEYVKKYVLTNFKDMTKISYKFINEIKMCCIRHFTEEELRRDQRYIELMKLNKNVPILIRNYYNNKFENVKKELLK
jgi:hypothetical protein